MKTFRYLFLLFALASIGLVSCTKEDVTTTTVDDPEIVDPQEGVTNPLVNSMSSGSEDGMDLGCFVIDFPFALMIGDDVVEVDADSDFEVLFASTDENTFVDFVYPFNITYADGSTEVIESGEELGEAFATCIPDEGWGYDSTFTEDLDFPAFLITADDYCYDIVYPITLTDLEGEGYTVASEDDFIDLIATTSTILFFDFPLMLIDDDVTVDVADSDELFEALLSCVDDGEGFDTTWNYGGEIGCYGVEFPFTAVLADGSTVQVDNHDELCALMIEGPIVGFEYPLTLIRADGSTLVVNSEEEFITALDDCWDGPSVGGEIDPSLIVLLSGSNEAGEVGCYDINWPLSFDYDDDIVSIASIDELVDYSDVLPELTLIYPVSVNLNDGGETVELASIEDTLQLVENCQ